MATAETTNPLERYHERKRKWYNEIYHIMLPILCMCAVVLLATGIVFHQQMSYKNGNTLFLKTATGKIIVKDLANAHNASYMGPVKLNSPRYALLIYADANPNGVFKDLNGWQWFPISQRATLKGGHYSIIFCKRTFLKADYHAQLRRIEIYVYPHPTA